MTAGLIKWFNSKGISTLGMKPFVCGATRKGKKLIYKDVELLKIANKDCFQMGTAPQEDYIAPLRWKPPLAPFRASRLERKPVNFKKLKERKDFLKDKCDLLFLEGIGGLLCPLTNKITLADWAREEKLPILLVARLGLGTLNHTLMTVEIAKQKGLKIKGIILNDFPKVQNDLSRKWNAEDLKQLTDVPILGLFPQLKKFSVESSARALERNFDFKKFKKII